MDQYLPSSSYVCLYMLIKLVNSNVHNNYTAAADAVYSFYARQIPFNAYWPAVEMNHL